MSTPVQDPKSTRKIRHNFSKGPLKIDGHIFLFYGKSKEGYLKTTQIAEIRQPGIYFISTKGVFEQVLVIGGDNYAE